MILPYRKVSGYVEQTDIHVPTETVLEALRFSAYHRLPRGMPDREKDQIVEAVIDMIELRPIINKVKIAAWCLERALILSTQP